MNKGTKMVVDVWTHSAYRRQGIARMMMETLLAELPGQHVYLFTEDDTLGFYEALGLQEQGIGVYRIVGDWLDNKLAGQRAASHDSG